jgi:hypothetical protein
MKVSLASLLAITFLGCGGAPAHDPKVVKEAVYQTDYTTVWNAVSAEMNERFHDGGIKSEDPSAGTIISKFKSVATSASAEANSDPSSGRQMRSLGGDMIQLRVRIDRDGPPWRVVIESEGAHRSPDSPLLTPYVHGAIDEPVWVQGRADSLREAIYDRLKQYAVSTSAPAAPAGAPGPTETPPPPAK